MCPHERNIAGNAFVWHEHTHTHTIRLRIKQKILLKCRLYFFGEMLKLCHSSYYKHTYFHSQIVACDKNIIYEKLAQRWEREKKNEKWIEKKIYASMHVIALEMCEGKKATESCCESLAINFIDSLWNFYNIGFISVRYVLCVP